MVGAMKKPTKPRRARPAAQRRRVKPSGLPQPLEAPVRTAEILLGDQVARGLARPNISAAARQALQDLARSLRQRNG